MAKICAACGKKIGAFSDWQSTRNGCVCQSCFMLITPYRKDVPNMSDAEVSEAYKTILANNSAVASFSETDHIGDKLGYIALFDDASRSVLLPQRIAPVVADQLFWVFGYDEIVSAELLLNEKRVQTSGLARAAVGGLLLGPLGALAGYASAQDERARGSRDSVTVKVSVKNYPSDTYSVRIFEGGRECSDAAFETYLKQGGELVERLNAIAGYSPDEPEQSAPAPVADAPTEIRKFKALLDDGIITEEEFQAKKKQLLGL